MKERLEHHIIHTLMFCFLNIRMTDFNPILSYSRHKGLHSLGGTSPHLVHKYCRLYKFIKSIVQIQGSHKSRFKTSPQGFDLSQMPNSAFTSINHFSPWESSKKEQTTYLWQTVKNKHHTSTTHTIPAFNKKQQETTSLSRSTMTQNTGMQIKLTCLTFSLTLIYLVKT